MALREEGLLPLKPISDLPHGLGPLIKKLSPCQLTVPLGLGKKYCLVILHKYKPSRLDQQTEKVLLSRFLKEWIDCTVDHDQRYSLSIPLKSAKVELSLFADLIY